MGARPDQIELLTRGVTLPLPAVRREHLLIVVETLACAWSRLSRDHPRVAREAGEPDVSAMMESELCAFLDGDDGDGFVEWRQLVRAVARGKETMNFNGGRIETRPDLSIYLTGGLAAFPLVVECKLIDGSRGKGHDLYCRDGISRFVTGDYAWAAREALMMAYVRDDSSVATRLGPYLRNRQTQFAVVGPPVAEPRGALDLARSVHGRVFRYINQKPPKNEPGEISLWHLWLRPPDSS